MTLTDRELQTWTMLTDALPPTELPTDPGSPLRWFEATETDDRFPAAISMPTLLPGAPPRVLREWVSTLVAEVTGQCPCCKGQRRDMTMVRHFSCALEGFGRRARAWMLPGSIDALIGALAPPQTTYSREEQ